MGEESDTERMKGMWGRISEVWKVSSREGREVGRKSGKRGGRGKA